MQNNFQKICKAVLLSFFLFSFFLSNLNFAFAVGEDCTLNSDCPVSGEVCNSDYKCVAPPKPSPAETSPSPSPSTGGATGKAFCDTTGGNFTYENGLCLPVSKSGKNSLAGTGTLPELITKVLKALLTFAGVFAVVAMVYGGYLYIAAAGNEEMAEKGRGALVNSTIGLVVILLAYALVNIVVSGITK